MDNLQISPKFALDIAKKVSKKLTDDYSNDEIRSYLMKFHKDCYNDLVNMVLIPKNFKFEYVNNSSDVVDVFKTLMSMPGDVLIKVAMDLGIETPGFIPAIPEFKQEIRKISDVMANIFDEAYKVALENPKDSASKCSSTLESLLKEILTDSRVAGDLEEAYNSKDTLAKNVGKLIKVFKSKGQNIDRFNELCTKIFDSVVLIGGIRNNHTVAHGHEQNDILVDDPMYAYFIINATSTLGLFLLDCYKKFYPAK